MTPEWASRKFAVHVSEAMSKSGSDNFHILLRCGLSSAWVGRYRVQWAIAEDRRQAVDKLTDHRVRLMANLIADEFHARDQSSLYRAAGIL